MTALATKETDFARAPLEPLLTVEDLEGLLGVSKRTILRLRKQGLIPEPLQIGGSHRWRHAAIVAALDAIENGCGQEAHEDEKLLAGV